MNGKEFCRLCLNEVYVASSNNANLSDSQTRQILASIFTDMNTALTNAVKLCEDCFNNVNFIVRVKQGFLLKNKDYVLKNGHEPHGRQCCKLCFRFQSPFNILLHEGNYSAQLLKQTIDIALPESKFALDMAVCGACWCWIKKIFHFKRRCFNMEENLKFYCSKKKVNRLNDSDLENFLTEHYYIRARSDFEEEAPSTYPKGANATEHEKIRKAALIVEEVINLVDDDEVVQYDLNCAPRTDGDNCEHKIDICENKLENHCELSNEGVIVFDGNDEMNNVVISVDDDDDSKVKELNKVSENGNDNNNNNLRNTASHQESESMELCTLNPNGPKQGSQFQRNGETVSKCPQSNNDNNFQKRNPVSIDDDCYEVIIDESSNIIDLTNIDNERVTNTQKDDLWGCHACVAIFTGKGTVRKHLLSHEDPWNKYGRFECKSCPFRSNWKGSVTRHEFYHTKEIRNKFAGKKLNYLCPYCNVIYASRGAIQSHLQEHVISWKRFQCVDCMFTATLSESLRLHYRVYHCNKKDPTFS